MQLKLAVSDSDGHVTTHRAAVPAADLHLLLTGALAWCVCVCRSDVRHAELKQAKAAIQTLVS